MVLAPHGNWLSLMGGKRVGVFGVNCDRVKSCSRANAAPSQEPWNPEVPQGGSWQLPLSARKNTQGDRQDALPRWDGGSWERHESAGLG